MKRVLSVNSVCLVGLGALVMTCTLPTLALAQFGELIKQIPRSANAVVLLNMEKAKQSPMGVREGWTKKVEKAFEAGLYPVPPQAKRFVLASQIDLEFMEPVWSAAIIDLAGNWSMEQIAKRHGGTLDTLSNLSAVALPNDSYAVQFAPQVLGAMSPATAATVQPSGSKKVRARSWPPRQRRAGTWISSGILSWASAGRASQRPVSAVRKASFSATASMLEAAYGRSLTYSASSPSPGRFRPASPRTRATGSTSSSSAAVQRSGVASG